MSKQAQTTLEYAVLLAVIVAGLIAMSFYMQRSLSGRLRDNAGQLSEGMFYSPRATTAHSEIITSGSETSSSTYIINATTNETSSDTVNKSSAGMIVTTNSVESLPPLNEEPERW